MPPQKIEVLTFLKSHFSHSLEKDYDTILIDDCHHLVCKSINTILKQDFIKNVKHYFGEKEVLKGINLDIKAGEIFGLLGPSGAGKTTLINLLTGQIKHTEGEIEVSGKNIVDFKGTDYQKIGIMMDSFGLYDRLNCYDNLKFFCKINGVSEKKIGEVMELVSLKGAEKTLAMNLSKGMRSRLLLARVLLGSPEILFLDEPTSGLDPATTESIHQLIREEREKGTTIFLTTHNMVEAETLCDNIALLNEGKLVEYGCPVEICRKYNHQKKILIHLTDGQDEELSYNEEGAALLQKYMAEEKLETIHSTEPNLETVFMELTGRKFE